MEELTTRLVCVKDYERVAKVKLKKVAWDYYSEAADEETTFNECLVSYQR